MSIQVRLKSGICGQKQPQKRSQSVKEFSWWEDAPVPLADALNVPMLRPINLLILAISIYGKTKYFNHRVIEILYLPSMGSKSCNTIQLSQLLDSCGHFNNE